MIPRSLLLAVSALLLAGCSTPAASPGNASPDNIVPPTANGATPANQEAWAAWQTFSDTERQEIRRQLLAATSADFLLHSEACRTLAGFGPRIIPLLLDLPEMKRRHPFDDAPVAPRILQAIFRQMDDPGVLSSLDSPHPPLRTVALREWGERGLECDLGRVIPRLEDPDSGVAAACLETLRSLAARDPDLVPGCTPTFTAQEFLAWYRSRSPSP